MTTEVFAPAKINLALHVTGRRDDGYHRLDSLVVFLDVGDTVRVRDADETTLLVKGPMAGEVPAGQDNLVLKAADMMANAGPAEISLFKELPVAAGIGGGSSDAAATLVALSGHSASPLPPAGHLLRLGADVPACLAARPLRMSGIGEQLRPIDLPAVHLVLVNPSIALPTGRVFGQLRDADNQPMPEELPAWRDADELALWLGDQRNDLEMPARALVPEIGRVLDILSAVPGALLARMSGSGATCFAIFASRQDADAAALELKRDHPDWWIVAASDWRRPS